MVLGCAGVDCSVKKRWSFASTEFSHDPDMIFGDECVFSRFPGESAAMGKRCFHVFRVPEASPRSGFTKEFHVGGGVDVGLLVGGEKITVPTRGPNSIKRLALVFCSQNTPEDVAPSHNIPHSGRALLGGLLEGQ